MRETIISLFYTSRASVYWTQSIILLVSRVWIYHEKESHNRREKRGELNLWVKVPSSGCFGSCCCCCCCSKHKKKNLVSSSSSSRSERREEKREEKRRSRENQRNDSRSKGIKTVYFGTIKVPSLLLHSCRWWFRWWSSSEQQGRNRRCRRDEEDEEDEIKLESSWRRWWRRRWIRWTTYFPISSSLASGEETGLFLLFSLELFHSFFSHSSRPVIISFFFLLLHLVFYSSCLFFTPVKRNYVCICAAIQEKTRRA